MKHYRKTITALIVSGGLISTTAVLYANDKDNISNGLNEVSIPMNKAVDIALNAVPGMAYEAEFEFEDGKPVWEIELVDANNNAYELEIDANSGEILSKELEND